MSLHKLTAGSGYDYLTRQVAALDATEKGHTGLASYYADRGETPGQWVGSGLAGIDGLSAGDVVTAEQMQNLFGSGHHPLAQQRTAALPGPRTVDDVRAATRLGAPFKVYDGDVSAFRVEVAKRLAAVNEAAGLPGDWPVPSAERARVRTEVATEFFRAEHGRDPDGARELAATIAKHSQPRTTAVAGYDLCFSPVKSVSTLWAVADQSVAAQVELAHQAALRDALRFIERHALFTRCGTNGIRQVEVTGLVATAFTHRDSRAGDPDLHTHVAVANKVQTEDGRWLSIDGRVLYKAAVTASETYNTALEKHLSDRLGVRFAERGPGHSPTPGAPSGTATNATASAAALVANAGKRPVREIVGVDPALNERWSARRASIQARRAELAAQFQATHGRPPTPIESVQLAQQATLETRQAKHEPRTLAEQRSTWRAEAAAVLGSERAVDDMVNAALSPAAVTAATVDTAWVDRTADRILAAVQQRRATWQVWHVRAEAHRQVRAAAVATDKVDRLVDLLVDEVLHTRSISLARPLPGAHHDTGAPWAPGNAGASQDVEGIQEPAQLRRRDGASVYTVAGADLHTSAAVLEAEQRLVHAAGMVDGRVVDDAAVTVALLESAANGIDLNAGQADLVRTMATSGARVQLAIAPAGSGKTTAMRALVSAWESGGGQVIGLAPSAAAAAALREQIDARPAASTGEAGQPAGVRVDTLAKVTWSLSSGQLPDWVDQIGPTSLVLIDEAGMADTLSLDAVVQHVLDRGGSVRLVGDDQQLAAIGAGGVLRDIRNQHGAVHLTELMRFADPAEGAATLALREGRPEALGFYLDHDRIHVGDLATNTEATFEAWLSDRGRGLDTIMLAPTRELVHDLNHRAREHRLRHDRADGTPREGSDRASHGAVATGPVVRLADGNDASVGDLVLTRTNNRRLRVSATDWVKNGDRWSVLAVQDGGSLTVQHTRSGRTVALPADYVAESTELGYAATIHTAQGVSVDTVHGLATGQESRQLLYTMLTRGRLANHAYLEVVGDGDPHSVIHPDSTHPRTPTQILEQVLARDESPTSATSQMRELADPATRLGDAAACYLDALYVAAQDVAGADGAASLDGQATDIDPALTEQPAWPALRAHLLLMAASGDDPGDALRAAAGKRDFDTAGDLAAVLDWRLDSTGLRNAGPGPLPWMPAVPTRLTQHPTWGPYLQQRADLVDDLAGRVHDRAASDPRPPTWAQTLAHLPDPAVVADVEVWRAATGIPESDRRATGPRQLQKSAASWQRRLDRRVTGQHAPATREWGPLLETYGAGTRHDPFAATLAERLAALHRAGLPARQMLHRAVTEQSSLPDDHPAAALWWRINRRLTPDVTEVATAPGHRPAGSIGAGPTWAPDLIALIGADRADRFTASPYWPALAAAVDHGHARGWAHAELLAAAVPSHHLPDVDECQATVWRVSILTDPSPDRLDLSTTDALDPYGDHPDADPPEDLYVGLHAPEDAPTAAEVEHHYTHSADDPDPHTAPTQQDGARPAGDRVAVPLEALHVPGLPLVAHWAARARDAAGPVEPDSAWVERALRREIDWHENGHTRARLTLINELTALFYEAAYPGSWGQQHLTERLGADIAGDTRFRPGHAPAGWTHLVDHLRGHGITDAEMLAAGVATTARTGRLIDRFRDRVVLPIATADGTVLGFVGRRHPDRTDDDNAGPKYLNTPDTVLFHKGAQLYAPGREHFVAGATAVRVEGPLDAIAVTLATGGSHVGVAPLGTALTDEQAAELASIAGATGRRPIIATDADLAGVMAAERDYWMLAPHRVDPALARLPRGADPADILTTRGPTALAATLRRSADRSLADALIDERLTHLPPDQALLAAADVAAARPPDMWDQTANTIATRLWTSHDSAADAVLGAAVRWSGDPRRAAQLAHQQLNTVRDRLTQTYALPPEQRWRALATRVDPRLPHEGDWPALADMLQAIDDDGDDLPAVLADATIDHALNDQPAQDLRYRLIALGLPRVGGPTPTPPLTAPAPDSAASADSDAWYRRREVNPAHSQTHATSAAPPRRPR